MLEVIKVIALLCQIGSGQVIKGVQLAQHECQTKYLMCYDKQNKEYKDGYRMQKCIVEHKVVGKL